MFVVDVNIDIIYFVEDGMFDFFINGCKMVIFYDLYIRVNIFNFIDVVVDLKYMYV